MLRIPVNNIHGVSVGRSHFQKRYHVYDILSNIFHWTSLCFGKYLWNNWYDHDNSYLKLFSVIYSSKRRHSSLWIILQFSKLHVPVANSVFTSCNHTQHSIARCFFHIIHGAVWAIRYMIKTEISKSQIAHSRHHESFRNADGSLRQRTRRLIASVSSTYIVTANNKTYTCWSLSLCGDIYVSDQYCSRCYIFDVQHAVAILDITSYDLHSQHTI